MSPEDSTSDKVRFELSQIVRELQIINRVNQIRKVSTLDEIQVRAAASSLHSIYNGIEKILVFTLWQRNLPIGESTSWHSEVLDVARKNGVVSEALENDLRDLMGFRHFFRHNYGFMLDGELLKPLLDKVTAAVEKLKLELELEK